MVSEGDVTPQDVVVDLYAAYCRSTEADERRRLSSEQWLRLYDALYKMAINALRSQVRSGCKIPGRTWADVAENIRGEMLKKFLHYKLDERELWAGDPRPQDIYQFKGLLKQAARNQCITELRKIRSVLAGGPGFEGGEQTLVYEPAPQPAETDVFQTIRDRMGHPFRFHEFPHVREILLGALLISGRFPAPTALRRIVRPDVLQACFNAAVYDINEALLRIEEDEGRRRQLAQAS